LNTESDPCYGYWCHPKAQCKVRYGQPNYVCNYGYRGTGEYCASHSSFET